MKLRCQQRQTPAISGSHWAASPATWPKTLARLGVPTTLLTAVGDDAFGHQILSETSAGGVDTSKALLCPACRSGAYLAILNEHGDMAVSIDDMRICSEITPQYVRAQRKLLAQAQMIVVDANLSPKTLDAILKIAHKAGAPVCADPVSNQLAQRLVPAPVRIHYHQAQCTRGRGHAGQ